jgi:PPOX class probable F420-dependent enzyme
VEVPPPTVEALLASWPVARLATRTEEGGVFQIPIVFTHCRDRLWSPVDGKPKRSSALSRLSHVRANPRVSLLLDHYDSDWTKLWWIRIEARADVVRLADDPDPEIRKAVEEALREKYPQYADTPPFLGIPTALAMRVESTRSWCASAEALRVFSS